MVEAVWTDRPLWWRQIIDQFQSLRRELAAKVPDGVVVEVTEESDQIILLIQNTGERTPLLSLIARCEEDTDERTLVLIAEIDDESEELLRLVWHLGPGLAVERHARRSQGRGLNISADRREGLFSEGDAVELLRERFLTSVTSLKPQVREPRRVPVLGPAGRALRAKPITEIESVGNVVTLRALERPDNPPVPAIIPETPPRPPLMSLSDADRAEFEKVDGLYRDFALACRGVLQPGDIASYAQRVLELMVTQHRAELRARNSAAAAAVGMKGALKLLGVAVAFGVEVAAATFGFGAWLKAGWEGMVYALTGVGLIGGGLVPITKGKDRELVMKVAVAWSIAVAALTMQNPKLVEPLQEQMRVFHRIDPITELRLTNARSKFRSDEDRKARLEAELKAAQSSYLGARRNPNEPRRDFHEGEKKREEAVKALQRQLKQQDVILKTDRDQLAEAEQAWQGAALSDRTRYVAAAIVFTLSALVGALGPIYLGLWLDERQAIHHDSLSSRRARHTLRTRTRALEKNESTQRAEVQHIVASMRAYYADLLTRQQVRDPYAELDRVFVEGDAIVDRAVKGFLRARGLTP